MEVSAECYLAADRATIKLVHDGQDFKVLYNDRVKSSLSELLKDVESLGCD